MIYEYIFNLGDTKIDLPSTPVYDGESRTILSKNAKWNHHLVTKGLIDLSQIS